MLEFDPASFEVVWEYGSESGSERLDSALVSNAQRLPNGNTLITEGMTGRQLRELAQPVEE